MPIRNRVASLWLLAAAAVALAPSPSYAYLYSCPVRMPGYLPQASRGDILLCRTDNAPAGAVIDNFGQYYTHAGVMLDQVRVRHNTAALPPNGSMDFWENLATKGVGLALNLPLVGSAKAYELGQGAVDVNDFRNGLPGLATSNIVDTSGAAPYPWQLSQMTLVKLVNGTQAMGSAIAAASEAISGMRYDVHAYVDYAANTPAANMCSGAVKYATDQAGLGMFQLHTYTPAQVGGAARSMFDYVYPRVRPTVDKKFCFNGPLNVTICTADAAARDAMATGIANRIVELFLDRYKAGAGVQSHDSAVSFWQNYRSVQSVSISPDDLIDANLQTSSLYAQTTNVGHSSSVSPFGPSSILVPGATGYMPPYWAVSNSCMEPDVDCFLSCNQALAWHQTYCSRLGGAIREVPFQCTVQSNGYGGGSVTCGSPSGAYVGGRGFMVRPSCP